MKKFAILFLSALLFAHPVFASTPEEIETQIEELEKQKDQIEEQIAELRAQTVEWKHYDDGFVAFDYPVRPYEISKSYLKGTCREYFFRNLYENDADFEITFYKSDEYDGPFRKENYQLTEQDGAQFYRLYGDDGTMIEQYYVEPANDVVTLVLYFRSSDESLPVYKKLLSSVQWYTSITPKDFEMDERSEYIQDNNYYTEDEIEDIEAVIQLTEKYLNMDVTKEEVKDRISSYSGVGIYEAFDIAFAMISEDDSKIRETVRKLKQKLENRLPDK